MTPDGIVSLIDDLEEAVRGHEAESARPESTVLTRTAALRKRKRARVALESHIRRLHADLAAMEREFKRAYRLYDEATAQRDAYQKAMEEATTLLGRIRAECKVIYWPPPSEGFAYPIEHNMNAKKDSWDYLRTALARPTKETPNAD